MSGSARDRPGAAPGLCGSCVHSRIIRNARGSTFRMCLMSRVDAAFPKYPPLPVLSCRGYEMRQAQE